MNDESAGLEPADTSGAVDPAQSHAGAIALLRQLKEAQETLLRLSEHKAAREIEDVIARVQAWAAREGISCS